MRPIQRLFQPVSLFFLFSLLYLAILNLVQFPVMTLLKPLPILCLLLLVYFSQLENTVKTILSAALIFSMAGDIGLTLPLEKQLELGLVCFLFAHMTYIYLFIKGSSIHFSWIKTLLSILIACISSLMLYLLYPYLGPMTLPVLVYVAVITVMGLFALQMNWIIAFGAVLFMLSDALIAFNQFVFKQADFMFWIMLTYYLAQLFIVKGSIGYFADKISFKR